MAGNVLIKNANGNTVTLQNPDTNLADVVVDTSKIASKQYVDDADALKVALSSFTGTNQSLVNNGYQKLPGGLIIQWGTAPGAGSDRNILYPIAFPSAVLGVYTTMVSGVISTTEVQSVGTGNITSLTSFSVYPRYQNTFGSSGYATQPLQWFAIGY